MFRSTRLKIRTFSTSSTSLDSKLFINSIFPIRYSKFDPRHLLARIDKSSLKQQLQSQISAVNSDVQVIEVTPREIDGGVIVKLNCTELDPALVSAIDYRGSFLNFNFSKAQVHEIKGSVWNEDLNRFPSKGIRVDFDGPDLSQEQAFDLFRPFGKIHNIVELSPASKDLPRYITLYYESAHSSAAARNCLHLYQFPLTSTMLRINYIERKSPDIFSFFSNHPRIFLPLMIALFGSTAAFLFDPIRELSVQSHIEGQLDFNKWKFFSFLKKETLKKFGFSTNAVGGGVGLGSALDEEERLKNWLTGVPDTFIIVQGPRGSGKELVVNNSLQDQPYQLIIDTEQISKSARSDEQLVSLLSNSVNYFPQFAFLSSITGVLDLASVGLIGTKTGFSSSISDQLKAVLDTSAIALKTIVDKQKKKAVAGGADVQVQYPIVVIRNFGQKVIGSNKTQQEETLSTAIAEFAALLVENQIAHVIFTSSLTTSPKALAKALSTRPFNVLSLNDASVDAAFDYISTQLARPLQSSAKLAIAKLGGRRTDLELLLSKMKTTTGLTIEEAVDEIISRAAAELRKSFFDVDVDAKKKKLGWILVKELAEHKELKYAEVLVNVFKLDEIALREFETLDLISVHHTHTGRPSLLRPSSPLQHSAFNLIVSDKLYAASLDYASVTSSITREESELREAENHLKELSAVSDSNGWKFGGKIPKEVEISVERCLEVMRISQDKLKGLEKKEKQLLEILKTEV